MERLVPCVFCGEPAVEWVEVYPAEDKGHTKAGARVFRAAVGGWVCAHHKAKLEHPQRWEDRERAARKVQRASMEASQMTLGQKL